MKRRNFLQWAALAAAQSALPVLGKAPDLAASVTLRRQGDELLARFELVNRGPALEVLIELGDRPGLEVQGELTADGQTEPLVPIGLARHEVLNRAGPRRVWKPLPPLGRLEAGTFRFQRRQERSAGERRQERSTILGVPSEGMVSFQLLVQTDHGPVRLIVDQVKLAEA